MSSELLGQIIGLAALGLVFLATLAYIIKFTIIDVIKWYFSAKLMYMSAIMQDKPVDTLHEMARELAKRQAARTMANGKDS